MQVYSVKNIHELNDVASKILNLSISNTLFCFYKNLDAGKTTLIKLVCEQLQVLDIISSPTYPIINEYKTTNQESIYHIDLYRLNSTDEAHNIGLEDYLYSNAICFIEWPDNFESIIPEKHIKIKITKLDDDSRNIEIL